MSEERTVSICVSCRALSGSLDEDVWDKKGLEDGRGEDETKVGLELGGAKDCSNEEVGGAFKKLADSLD